MRKCILLIAFICSVLVGKAIGLEPDSTTIESVQLTGDSVLYIKDITQKPHSPHKATIYAMVCPGLGQIYNKQWYKVPILYAGIAAAVYGMNFNVKYFNRYKNAYSTFYHYNQTFTTDPNGDHSLTYQEAATLAKVMSFLVVSNGDKNNPQTVVDNNGNVVYKYNFFESTNSQERINWQTRLKNKKDKFRRQRDLLYLTFVGIYAVQIIDACVYAHFYDFEINEDLSMQVHPVSTYDPFLDEVSMGLSVSLKF